MFAVNLAEPLKPWLRAVKYGWLKYSANYQVRQRRLDNLKRSPPPIFLIGCGRSGTTILGYVLSLHPDVRYFFEPYHLWAAIDPTTDMLNFYHRTDAHYFMNESHCTKEAQLRFQRVFLDRLDKIVLEKTPVNAVRISYLKALAPRAKFIHIVRDGVDASCSIERLALTNSYKIASKPELNQWWGVKNYKWQALSEDGAATGYYPNEVAELKDHRSKGAYEWLVSLGEVDRWREQLKLEDRLYEITYPQLTKNPESTLENLCGFLNLECSTLWLERAIGEIQPARQAVGKTLILPPTMCEAFNDYQKRFGFANRAICAKIWEKNC